MKRSPDNQINALFIDISRNKWLVFLLRSSFFRTTRPLASTEATAYYRPAPGRTDSIPERHQRQWSWIKELCKNPQKSELIHWRQCLLSGATEPCPLGLRETLACIHVIPHNVKVLTWLPAKLAKKRKCVLRRPPICGWKKNCRFIRHPTRSG